MRWSVISSHTPELAVESRAVHSKHTALPGPTTGPYKGISSGHKGAGARRKVAPGALLVGVALPTSIKFRFLLKLHTYIHTYIVVCGKQQHVSFFATLRWRQRCDLPRAALTSGPPLKGISALDHYAGNKATYLLVSTQSSMKMQMGFFRRKLVWLLSRQQWQSCQRIIHCYFSSGITKYKHARGWHLSGACKSSSEYDIVQHSLHIYSFVPPIKSIKMLWNALSQRSVQTYGPVCQMIYTFDKLDTLKSHIKTRFQFPQLNNKRLI